MEQIRVEKTASRGIAVEKIYLYLEPDLTPDTASITEDQVQAEIDKFAASKAAVIAELNKLAEQNEIFAAHLEIADDFMLQDGVEGRIKNDKKNVQQAVSETIDEFAMIFASMDDVPKQAYTMGIKTIMQAKKILVVVSGEDKAAIIKEAFFGPITPQVQASVLQLHNDVTIVADEAALSLVK